MKKNTRSNPMPTPKHGVAISEGIRLSWPKFLLLLLVVSVAVTDLYPRAIDLLDDGVHLLQRHKPGSP